MEKFTCGQRSFGALTESVDFWRDDDTCSYCGSLNPEILMKRLEERSVEIIPTDKTYKIYVRALPGTEKFKQSYRTDNDSTGDTSKWVWVTREIDETKFYFQHFSSAQRARFIELHNTKTMQLGFPGHFYTLPYFCVTSKE